MEIFIEFVDQTCGPLFLTNAFAEPIVEFVLAWLVFGDMIFLFAFAVPMDVMFDAMPHWTETIVTTNRILYGSRLAAEGVLEPMLHRNPLVCPSEVWVLGHVFQQSMSRTRRRHLTTTSHTTTVFHFKVCAKPDLSLIFVFTIATSEASRHTAPSFRDNYVFCHRCRTWSA